MNDKQRLNKKNVIILPPEVHAYIFSFWGQKHKSFRKNGLAYKYHPSFFLFLIFQEADRQQRTSPGLKATLVWGQLHFLTYHHFNISELYITKFHLLI